jgi:hypothetical protein
MGSHQCMQGDGTSPVVSYPTPRASSSSTPGLPWEASPFLFFLILLGPMFVKGRFERQGGPRHGERLYRGQTMLPLQFYTSGLYSPTSRGLRSRPHREEASSNILAVETLFKRQPCPVASHEKCAPALALLTTRIFLGIM